MNEEMLNQADPRDAEEMCRQIADKAAAESKEIIDKARENADRISRQIRETAEKEAEQIIADADKETADMEEKTSAFLNMERKRILLREKGVFAQKVIEQVEEKAKNFRSNPAYPETLKRFIYEGQKVVAAGELIIFYSQKDREIFNDTFRQDVLSLLKKNNPGIAAEFREDEFDDIGIIVKSKDQRIGYDNRFAARLKRNYQKVYAKLIKEAA